eukprot:6188901-Pleurochrysis_carterae.AAC.2
MDACARGLAERACFLSSIVHLPVRPKRGGGVNGSFRLCPGPSCPPFGRVRSCVAPHLRPLTAAHFYALRPLRGLRVQLGSPEARVKTGGQSVRPSSHRSLEQHVRVNKGDKVVGQVPNAQLGKGVRPIPAVRCGVVCGWQVFGQKCDGEPPAAFGPLLAERFDQRRCWRVGENDEWEGGIAQRARQGRNTRDKASTDNQRGVHHFLLPRGPHFLPLLRFHQNGLELPTNSCRRADLTQPGPRRRASTHA